MRFFTCILISCFFMVNTLISSCSLVESDSQIELPPDVIRMGNDEVKYNTTEVPETFLDAQVDFIINKDNLIREMRISDKNIVTFKGISVGDSADKVKLAYKYEGDDDRFDKRCYMVLLNGTNEVDYMDRDIQKEASWIWIVYYVEDGIIANIRIYDCLYGHYMK